MPFGDHLEVETARKSDDRLGDCRVARVGFQVGDEGDVDLQRVDRKVLQVRQRRVTGAEIVDRHREAFAELVQHLADRVEVVQQAGFRDLELQPRRLAGAPHDPEDAVREVLAVELPRRQVDGNA